MSRTAQVYNHGRLAGTLTETDEGSFNFRYEDSYLSDPTTEHVSLRIPKTSPEYTSDELFPFFDGLIPEGWLLDFTTKNWKVARDDRMGLLMAVCHDCIGSVHIGDRPIREKVSTSTAARKADLTKPSFERCLRCLEPFEKSQAEPYHERCSKLLFGSKKAPQLDLELKDISRFASSQISQRLAVTGVQRKLSLDLDDSSKVAGASSRLTVVGFMGNFILKPPTPDFDQLPEIEHTIMVLAEACGLLTAERALIPFKSGELAYITKRFDREGDQKIEMEDLCQLSNKPTKNKYKSSSEAAGHLIRSFSEVSGDDALKFFEHLLFAFIVGNADMHLKNFSLYRDPKTNFMRLSPAYDLVSTRLLISEKEDSEELALSLNGKKSKLKWTDFEAFGSALKIPNIVQRRTRDRLIEREELFKNLIGRSYLNDLHQKRLTTLLSERIHRLSV